MGRASWALRGHPAGPGRVEEPVPRWLEPGISGWSDTLGESVLKVQLRVGAVLEAMLEEGNGIKVNRRIGRYGESPLPRFL